MRILVVDDVWNFVEFAVRMLRQAGLEVDAIVVGYGVSALDGGDLADEDVLALVRGADVIFLDHNMPRKNGKELFEHWKGQGIDFSSKRVVGISSGGQPYLSEHFSAGNLHDAAAVKRFLGIS